MAAALGAVPPATAMDFRSEWKTCSRADGAPVHVARSCERLLRAGVLKGTDGATALNNRGSALVKLGKLELALRHFDEAIRVQPGFARAFNNRGIANRLLGELDAAVVDFGKAVAADPKFAQAYYNRGVVHRFRGETAAAIADFRQALRVDSGYVKAFNDAAWLLATAPGHRDGNLALRYATRAVELSDGLGMRDTLAAAYAELGRFDDAVREQQRAIDLASFYGAQFMVREFKERLALYQAGQTLQGATAQR